MRGTSPVGNTLADACEVARSEPDVRYVCGIKTSTKIFFHGASLVSVRACKRLSVFSSLSALSASIPLSFGQVSSPRERPDVSNKALITKTAPPITTESKASAADSAALHKLADDYYSWRNENYPVASSEAGLHTWDNRLTDYSAAKIAERAQHVRKLLDQVRAMKTEKWAER